MKHTAVIALGSNLNQPQQQVQAALRALGRLPESRLAQHSSLYLTAPVGYLEQPDFVNAVALLHTDLSALALLRQLQALENQFGRVRSFANAPRVLDLDLIDFDRQCIDSPELTLPHPRAHERGFVMQPLAEIAPDYPVGTWGSAAQLAARLSMAGVRRLAVQIHDADPASATPS